MDLGKFIIIQGHNWEASISIPKNKANTPLEYKFVVALWDNPLHGDIIWEAGDHNRIIELKPSTNAYYSQSKWNMEKITLNLLLSRDEANEGTKYYVIGNCKELGNWTKPKLMLDGSNTIRRSKWDSEECVMKFDFEIYRGKSKFHYYYMKKNKEYTVQRHPGRKYYLGSNTKTHTRCLGIQHPAGNTEIYEQCNFNELVYSRVTDRIFLGAYLKNS